MSLTGRLHAVVASRVVANSSTMPQCSGPFRPRPADTTRTASGRGTEPSLLDALNPVTFSEASPTSGANDATAASGPPPSTPNALGVVVMTFTSESTETWAMALPLNTFRFTVLPSSNPVTPGTMPAPRRTATRGATARPTWLWGATTREAPSAFAASETARAICASSWRSWATCNTLEAPALPAPPSAFKAPMASATTSAPHFLA